MQTLHDMLKREPSREERKTSPSDDLGRRYSKIGISAVAAAAQFNCGRETNVKPLGRHDRGSFERSRLVAPPLKSDNAVRGH